MRVAFALRSAIVVVLVASASSTMADDDFDRPPISYTTSTPENRISRLQAKLDRGEVEFEHSRNFGYLRSVLKALDVPIESQMLVFSKTSLQVRYIAPRTPRAVYFRDDVYVGYCQKGDVLEISAVDPQLGTVFYTLDQQPGIVPRFERRGDNCLICHSSSRTEGVPGHLVRSMFVDQAGQPLFSGRSRTVDHTTPVDQRWGGWYVTGSHGSQTHLGNLTIRGRQVQEPVDNPEGQNVLTLDDRLDVGRYLSPHSDIVALMVLEHQVLIHNQLTKFNFDTRQAVDYDSAMRQTLRHPDGELLGSTSRRIKSHGDRLVDSLLFVGEAQLKEPIRGTSGYAEQFVNEGPRDSQGRSLRDLDFTNRMFKYPCSYLIYSAAFEALPRESKEFVWSRLWEILSGQDRSKKFDHLSASDRQAIVEILRDTKPDLPDYWR